MNKEFVPYEPSLALKELGFDETCFGYYGENQELIWKSGYAPWVNSERNLVDNHFVTTPLYQQAFRWFREKYNLYQDISAFAWNYDKKQLGFSIRTYLNPVNIETERKIYGEVYKTYEEAELACLIKLIEIVKNK